MRWERGALHAWGMQPREAPSPAVGASQLLFQAFSRLKQASLHCFEHISKCHCFLNTFFSFFFLFCFFLFCFGALFAYKNKAYILQSETAMGKGANKRRNTNKTIWPRGQISAFPPIPPSASHISALGSLFLLWQRAAGRAG